MYDHANGTLRNGVLLQPASTSRRWWARILDAVFVLVFTGVVIGIALALSAVGVISLDAATGVCLASYPLMALVFGALYGCTVSPPARHCAGSCRCRPTSVDASASGEAWAATSLSRSSRS
ncbi:hypothetical protein CXR29_14905 [Brevibacterium linens]|nr:hypothetical protein CXR29_14905 [Brevibacterium linens]